MHEIVSHKRHKTIHREICSGYDDIVKNMIERRLKRVARNLTFAQKRRCDLFCHIKMKTHRLIVGVRPSVYPNDGNGSSITILKHRNIVAMVIVVCLENKRTKRNKGTNLQT